MCEQSIDRLTIIFNNAITTGVFPESWKRGNLVPVHKKECKNLVKGVVPPFQNLYH